MGNTPWLLVYLKFGPLLWSINISEGSFFFSEIGIDVTFQKATFIAIHFLFSVLFMTQKHTDDFIMRAYYVEMEI